MVSIDCPRTLPGICSICSIPETRALSVVHGQREKEIASLHPVPLMLGPLPPSQQGSWDIRTEYTCRFAL